MEYITAFSRAVIHYFIPCTYHHTPVYFDDITNAPVYYFKFPARTPVKVEYFHFPNTFALLLPSAARTVSYLRQELISFPQLADMPYKTQCLVLLDGKYANGAVRGSRARHVIIFIQKTTVNTKHGNANDPMTKQLRIVAFCILTFLGNT